MINNIPIITMRKKMGILLLTCMTLLIASCKKTETIPYEEPTKNKITEFKVVNAPDDLYGIIDHSDNTITIYIPYYMGMSVIAPKIALDEGASLLDENGNAIDIREDLDPIEYNTDGYQYTVASENNIIRNYTVIQKIMPYPSPLLLGYSVERSTQLVNYESPYKIHTNAMINVYGNFQSTNMNAKITLTNVDTKKSYDDWAKMEVRQSFTGPTGAITPGESYYSGSIWISADAEPGVYDIHLEHQGRVAKIPQLHLYSRIPNYGVPYSSAYTYKPGDPITLEVTGGSNRHLEKIYLLIDPSKKDTDNRWRIPENFPENLYNQYIELEIIEQTTSYVKVKFPDLPPGIYQGNYTQKTDEFGLTDPADAALKFYADYTDESGWGKKVYRGYQYTFEVK